MQISILIITKKYSEKDLSPQKALQLNSSGLDYEVIIAEGNNPSLQRNELAKAANGEYLLFLDNDSDPDQNLLLKYSLLVKKFPEVKVFGGPSLLKAQERTWDNLLLFFFTSAFGVGPFRSRYHSVGAVRFSDERELILSNLFIERKYFIEMGGFDKNFYPGEENEFLKRNGHLKAVHEPSAIVFRHPRSNLWQIFVQMFTYGNGRAKHLNFSNKEESLFLLPAFFSFYILSLLFLGKSFLYAFPLLAYLFLIVVLSVLQSQQMKITLLAPLFFMFAHFSYGLGVCTGILRYKILRRTDERELKHFKMIKIKSLQKFG